MELATYLGQRRERVEHAIEEALPPRHPDAGRLVEAMRYTLMLPGKRLRGIVCLAAGEVFGGRERHILPLAVAVEMVHAASLILDDLPAFDDAKRRRGAPANHRVYGEAVATLASVGLLNAAFRHLARESRPRWIGPDDSVTTIHALTDAVGEEGMVAGEALDLLARETHPQVSDLEKVHALKTGSLFIACAVEAGRRCGAGPTELAALRAYAKNLGLAFQITDDVLAVVGDPEQTGKDSGAATDGASFVSVAGVDSARRLAGELIDTAAQSLAPLGRRAGVLEEIARYVGRREA